MAVGGLGRITGVFYAALIIGVVDFTLKKYFPQGGTVFIYAMTILLLLIPLSLLEAIRNLDTPVETIVADPAGKAALDANLPGLTTHQHYEHLKGMSLRMIASMAPDQLTAEMLAKAKASLAAIK